MVEIIEQISNVNWRHMEVDIPWKVVPHCIEIQLLLHPGFVTHIFVQIRSERMMVLTCEVTSTARILRILSSLWTVESTAVVDGSLLTELGAIADRVAGTFAT